MQRPSRMCDFHKTGTCMAGDLCRFAHEAADKNGSLQGFARSPLKGDWDPIQTH